MKFLTLDIQNFCSIGDDFPTIRLNDRGLILILGDNQDAPKASSNGAGKSTPLEAFCWCVWGKLIREPDKADDVVHELVDQDCKVSVVFEEDGHTYRVTRYRKHSIGDLDTDNVKENDLVLLTDGINTTGNSVKETQETINSIIGLTFDVFCAMMPGTGLKAAQLGDTGIKELLEKILQTEALSYAYKIVGDRLNKKSKDLVKRDTSIDRQNVVFWSNKEKLTALQDKRDDWDNISAQAVRDLEEECAYCMDTILGLEKERHYHESVQERLPVLVSARDDVNADLEALASEETEYSESAASTLLAVSQELSVLTTKHKGVDNALGRIDRLGATCTECYQSVSEEITQKQSKALSDKSIELAKAILAKNDEISTWKVYYTKAANNISDQRKVAIGYLESIETEIASCQESKNRISILTNELESQNNHLYFEEEDIVVELRKENMFGDLVVKAEEELEGQEVTLEKDEKKQKKLVKELSGLEFWRDAFSPQGIRSHMLKSVTPVLNHIAQKNCQVLTDGEMQIRFSTQTTLGSGETREKFSIQVKQMHGGSKYKMNSEGEKQRADVVLAFTLADLASMRASKVIPFRFLDEPFERMDASGTKAVIGLLKQYEDKYNTTFVITHQESLKNIFPNRITITKKNGFSTMEDNNA